MKKVIQTLIDEKDIKELSKQAGKSGHTLSSFVRYIIKLFLRGGN